MNKKAELLLEWAGKVPQPSEGEEALFIEIGCIRHEVEDEDGWSSLYLARYCQVDCYEEGKKFLSFDNDLKAVKTAKAVLFKNELMPMVFHKDGVQALKQLYRPVNFLFLDSHKNPSFSLEQYRAAELAPGAILIVDDAQQIENWKFGKADFIQKIFEKRKMDYDIVETIPGWASFVSILPEGKSSGDL